MNAHHFQIRDPIHGVIFITSRERAVIDSRALQRLRAIKQVGFLDYAFPCATHSRYSHSVGAMHVASKIFDRVFDHKTLPSSFETLRQTVRCAALLHDIGHSPLSHTTEMFMPKLCDLVPDKSSTRQATHEDYTLKLILDSELSQILVENFSDLGISPAMIADLIMSSSSESRSFVVNGVNLLPILQQIISSEIDADRMDYLLRDSFFCGVNYGNFDSEWLINNLVSVEENSSMYLGIKPRAIFAFEDFLLSRYHMFASVYLHHTPVIMEKMLERFLQECPEAFVLSADINHYLRLDDMDLWQVLKGSSNSWARRIVERKPYAMLDESLGTNPTMHAHFDGIIAALKEADIDVIYSRKKSILSTLLGKHPLFVKTAPKNILLAEFSPLFARYRAPAELSRIFVAPQEKLRAQRVMNDYLTSLGLKYDEEEKNH